jgi:hypothetical protein
VSKPELVGPKGLRDEILDEHCIDPKIVKEAFTADVYKRFIEDRTRRLLSAIGQLVSADPIEED